MKKITIQGILYDQKSSFLKGPILGADILEYNPTRDINDMTAMICAKLFREIASKMNENNP